MSVGADFYNTRDTRSKNTTPPSLLRQPSVTRKYTRETVAFPFLHGTSVTLKRKSSQKIPRNCTPSYHKDYKRFTDYRKGYNRKKKTLKNEYCKRPGSLRCGGRVAIEGRRRGERESEDGKNEGERGKTQGG